MNRVIFPLVGFRIIDSVAFIIRIFILIHILYYFEIKSIGEMYQFLK